LGTLLPKRCGKLELTATFDVDRRLFKVKQLAWFPAAALQRMTSRDSSQSDSEQQIDIGLEAWRLHGEIGATCWTQRYRQ
jgi:hypothetical protein